MMDYVQISDGLFPAGNRGFYPNLQYPPSDLGTRGYYLHESGFNSIMQIITECVSFLQFASICIKKTASYG